MKLTNYFLVKTAFYGLDAEPELGQELELVKSWNQNRK
jgi:hypothetical protein